MSIDRALQLNTAAVAITGAVFLGLGHESTLIPVFLAAAALAAIGLTDVLRWLRLHRLVANGIAVIAVIFSLRGFFDKDSDDQLMAIANMLVFLQVVLLFQEKNARVYWQLLVLSLLQVVVAAALDLGPQFGVLLSIYIALALTSLVLLCIYRDLHPEPSPRGLGWPIMSGARDKPKHAAGQQTVQRDRAHATQQLLAPPEVGPRAVTEEVHRRDFTAGAIVRQVAALAGATFVFTTVFFYVTPRLTEGTWQGPRAKGATMGFVPEVRLEQGGRIHLSQQVVMRVSLTRMVDRRSVDFVGDPYFHGIALGDYVRDERGSRWVARRPPRRPRPPPITATNLARQDIVMETAHSPALFAIWPVQEIRDTPKELRANRSLYRIFRTDNEGPPLGRQLRYAYGTPAIKNGRQLHGIPHPGGLRTFREAHDLRFEWDQLLRFDPERFPTLAETAARVIREQDLEDGPLLQKALALERHFRAPDLYRYSLNLDVARNEALDPIEDFVANHRTGHCEYFASALALMLRSQGIPARIVAGYKGGDFNSLGRYYVVQQRHAHSWVEAWLPVGEVPDWEIAGPVSRAGTWYRLDPTPPEREIFTSSEEDSVVRRVVQAFDYVELLWRDYVLSLNASRQQNSVYDPLTEQAAALPVWSQSRSWQRWLRRWARRLGIELPSPRDRRQRIFQGELALVVAGGILLALLFVQVDRHLRRHLRRWLGWGPRESSLASKAPAFYIRLEKLLKRAGLRRGNGQTPHELAAAAKVRLADGPASGAVADLPRQIVQAYYRVRFGGERLDKVEADSIERALKDLTSTVKKR